MFKLFDPLTLCHKVACSRALIEQIYAVLIFVNDLVSDFNKFYNSFIVHRMPEQSSATSVYHVCPVLIVASGLRCQR